MIKSEIIRTESHSEAVTGCGAGAAWLRAFLLPAPVALCRAGVALVLILTLALAAPARAQCTAGWLPGAGVPGTSGSVRALAVLVGGDVIVGGRFGVAGSVAASYIARYNPTTGVWSALGAGLDGPVNVLAVLPGGHVIAGGGFYRAGGVAANNIARYNPTTGVWSAMGSGITNPVYALAVLPGGDVIVGGRFTTAGGVAASGIARYNPTTGVWSALGAGVTGGAAQVDALAVLPGGDVIAGGYFSTAGGVATKNIARYNPTTGSWSALGTGTNSGVLALVVLPGGDVIVGRDTNFTTAGGVAASRIARYNPTTGVWSALGAGVGGAFSLVYAFAVLPGGDVVVGGDFTSAGGVAVSDIGRCNPITGVWSALGAGTNGPVSALAVLPGGDVIMGGGFTTAGGVAANHIAGYNPTTGVWSAFGSGTNDGVYALAVLPGGDVIAGGFFGTAGGVASSGIARYNPTTGVWSAVGSGVTGGAAQVNALVVLPGGDVIAGGGFSTAGGVAANNIARYNPTTGVWSALGSGINNYAYALAVLPGGDVIVGGRFSTAGGVAANNIARYNPTTGVWSALGSGTSNSVYALAVLQGGDVIVGGQFTTAGGVAANNIARYAATAGGWSALEMYPDGSVYSLAVLAGGDVMVGAIFRSSPAGGILGTSVSRYNPTTGVRSVLGSGVNNVPSALAVLPGGDLILGGGFTIAGANVSAHFARYSFGPPCSCPLDYNLDTVINPDDIGDLITDYFTDPPIPGPGGYAIPCPENAPPYDVGYKTAFVPDGSGQCNQPFSDNLGDWITAYFQTTSQACP